MANGAAPTYLKLGDVPELSDLTPRACAFVARHLDESAAKRIELNVNPRAAFLLFAPFMVLLWTVGASMQWLWWAYGVFFFAVIGWEIRRAIRDRSAGLSATRPRLMQLRDELQTEIKMLDRLHVVFPPREQALVGSLLLLPALVFTAAATAVPDVKFGSIPFGAFIGLWSLMPFLAHIFNWWQGPGRRRWFHCDPEGNYKVEIDFRPCRKKRITLNGKTVFECWRVSGNGKPNIVRFEAGGRQVKIGWIRRHGIMVGEVRVDGEVHLPELF